MRNIEYLSPTSIAKFKENLSEFYLTYLADARAPRFPQTQPMSIGSAFDAYAKSFLHERIFGKGFDPQFDLDTIFNTQVEPHNRDWARVHGKHAFECYQRSGALADLLIELEQSMVAPKFELTIKGTIGGVRDGLQVKLGDVVFMGKPDVFYTNKAGFKVIFDWKVNGWCSKAGVSPMKGYVRLRSGSGEIAPSGPHKDIIPAHSHGTYMNLSHRLEHLNQEWAAQLSVYSWLCGAGIGEEFVAAIDQLSCRPGDDFPRVRVAEHRLLVSSDYQASYYKEAQEIWDIVHSNHIFREMSLEDSRFRCQTLDQQAVSLRGEGGDDDLLFSEMTR